MSTKKLRSEKLRVAVKFHSERTSGEVAEKLPGKLGELPGKSGDFPEARGSLTPSQRRAKFVSKKQGENNLLRLFFASEVSFKKIASKDSLGEGPDTSKVPKVGVPQMGVSEMGA